MTTEQLADFLDRLASQGFLDSTPELSMAAERLRNLHAQTRWQPIETAPKDGTPVSLWLPGVPMWFPQAFWNPITGRWEYFIHQGDFSDLESAPIGDFPPSHWRPLPQAPAKQEGGEA